ncbi:nitrite/sulfite reductase [Loigolactobacillus jiayinensis]|uniref:Nitrite/sulfite reductase n=1 Tax=Loigolactobacillus jiayinensis TaxID=2486016 RepID=A0ABW1RDJ0_9LACO|nr:nitrite/sulfite reductase [Loigolactobacillus jiayinensis]
MGYQITWADAKLNKNELSKLKKDGLDVFQDLPELVKKPFTEIDKSYYMYFKFAGLTVQKPQEQGNFMLRVKIPGGTINLKQARHLAGIATEYGHGYLDLTTRQAVQYHWIPFAKLPEVFAGINAVGLTTQGAEGDITRNVIDNPLSGIDPNELFDTRPAVQRVHHLFQGNRDYSNLPRKFKISINSNIYNAGNAEINDLAFVPATKRINGRTVKGFNLKVGGGLGMRPYLGLGLNIFVTRSQVAAVAEAVVKLYRDNGYRRSRTKARLKFLIQDWGVAEFEAKLREQLPKLATAGDSAVVGWSNGTALGIHPQKQAGYYYVGVSVPAGRISAADFRAFVDLAAKYGRDELRFDHGQNLLIPWIAAADLAAVKAAPIFNKFSYQPHNLVDFGTTCTGAEYCNLAYTHTKEIFTPLLAQLDQKFSFSQPVHITLTGCGNGCAHRSIADIGIEGLTAKTKDGQRAEAFKIAVGGSLLDGGHFTEVLKGKLFTTQLYGALAALLADYQTQQLPDETYYAYFQRLGVAHFQAILDTYLAQAA